jgi:hypothetical protein
MKVGVLGLLGVAFVVLKLIGQIAWPWVWVLAPFWIGLAIVAMVFGLGVVIIALGFVVKRIRS